jgi:hypothetical protein
MPYRLTHYRFAIDLKPVFFTHPIAQLGDPAVDTDPPILDPFFKPTAATETHIGQHLL